MTGIDLDALKDRWQQQGRRIDAALQLDVDAVRALLRSRTTGSLRRHQFRLGLLLAAGLATAAVLVAYIAMRFADPVYATLGVALLAIVVAEVVTDLRHWRAVRGIDLNAPIETTRAVFATLRTRRLRMERAILLTSVLLWWPLLAVVLNGLFGVDLLRRLHWSVAVINVAVGLVFIPFAGAIAGLIARRFGDSPLTQRLLDDLAGRDFSEARKHWDAQAAFEETLARGDTETALRDARGEPWSDEARAISRRLRLRLFLGILCYASLLLANGAFMLGFGGVASVIVPGVMLQLFWVLLMVPGIVQGGLISHWMRLPSAMAASSVRQLTGVREQIVSGALLVLPLALLVVLRSVVLVAARVDLWAATGPGLGSVVLVATAAVGVALFVAQRRGARIGTRLIDLLGFGALRLSRALVDRLMSR